MGTRRTFLVAYNVSDIEIEEQAQTCDCMLL